MTHARRDRCRSPYAGTPVAFRAALLLLLLMTAVAAQLLLVAPVAAQPRGPTGIGAGSVPAMGPGVNADEDVVAGDDIPAYHFSPLKLTGRVSADGKLARLQAEIEVHINRASGAWYDVPLKLTQAAITGIEYSGPMRPTPHEPDGPDDGVHWYFSGNGRHLLKLDLDVELRTAASGTNLQLTLPSGSRFFPSQLTLLIPQGNLQVEAGNDNAVKTTQTAEGETRVVATIEGNRIDLTWRPMEERRGTVVRVRTSIAVDRADEFLRINALQEFVTDGKTSEVRVRMPERFRLTGVTSDGDEVAVEEGEDNRWVRVRLGTSERPSLQLTWSLISDAPLAAGEWLVDGFEVEGAARQTGTIGIAPIPGFNVQRLLNDVEDGVEREEPRRTRPVGGVSFYRWAWRFDRQPFSLPIVIQEERPSFDVRTQAAMTAYEDRTVLDVDYHVQVHAGLVREVMLRWPAAAGQNWTLTPPGEGVSVTDATNEQSQFPGELQRIELAKPKDGDFTIRLQFQAPLAAGPFELPIPQIVSERILPAWLIVRGADAVEPVLDANPNLSPLTESTADDWLARQGYQPSRDQAYRCAEGPQVVTGVTRVFELEMTGSTVVSVTWLARDAFQVEQRITLDVRYGRINEVAFAWPPSFPADETVRAAAGIVCRTSDGQPISIRDEAGLLIATLPEAMQGRVQLIFEYRLPNAPDSPQVDIPVFVMATKPYATTLVEFPRSASLRIQPGDGDWKWVPTSLQPTWMTSEQRDSFLADVSFNVAEAPQKYEIERTIARAAFDASGGTRVCVDYSVRSAPARLVVRLPAGAERATFEWQGVRHAPTSVHTDESLGDRYELEVAEEPAEVTGRLRVRYQRSGRGGLRAIERLSCEFPVLPEAVSVTETYVEVGVPADYCALTYPQGLTSLMQWMPGLVFERELNPKYASIRESLLAEMGSPPAGEAADDFFHPVGTAHVYGFWSTGKSAAVSFRVISLWMLILLGSGLTLSLAFLLWSVPALRNVLTLLSLGCGVAVAGVFASEAVELLLQPVLLGLVAAVVAIGLQVQRPRDYMPPSSGRSLDRSTRSEGPSGSRSFASASRAPLATTQIGPREMQESGSRP